MASKKTKPVFEIAIVADVHLANHRGWGGPVGPDGLNRAAKLGIASLASAAAIAKENGASVLIVAGDLFQTPRPEPVVIAAVQQVFSDALATGLQVVVLPGNHDMPDATAEHGNTALAPLWSFATLVNDATGRVFSGIAVDMIPFDGTAPMREALKACSLFSPIGAPKEERRILVTHVGVYDDSDTKSAPWFKTAKDGIHEGELFEIMERAGIQQAFVGNFHEHRTWRDGPRTIVQIGTLAPHSFSDAGLVRRGLVALTDGATVIVRETPGVRFLQTMGPRPEALDDRHSYVVRQVGGARMDDSEVEARGWLAYEHLPEKAKTEKSATLGARDAAPDPLTALAAHVTEAPMPPELDSITARAKVLDLVKGAWKAAG
jgi:predicted MPP superfamily phosphohydrolase